MLQWRIVESGEEKKFFFFFFFVYFLYTGPESKLPVNSFIHFIIYGEYIMLCIIINPIIMQIIIYSNYPIKLIAKNTIIPP